MFSGKEGRVQDENATYITECEEMDDTLLSRYTIGVQKENRQR